MECICGIQIRMERGIKIRMGCKIRMGRSFGIRDQNAIGAQLWDQNSEGRSEIKVRMEAQLWDQDSDGGAAAASGVKIRIGRSCDNKTAGSKFGWGRKFG